MAALTHQLRCRTRRSGSAGCSPHSGRTVAGKTKKKPPSSRYTTKAASASGLSTPLPFPIPLPSPLLAMNGTNICCLSRVVPRRSVLRLVGKDVGPQAGGWSMGSNGYQTCSSTMLSRFTARATADTALEIDWKKDVAWGRVRTQGSGGEAWESTATDSGETAEKGNEQPPWNHTPYLRPSIPLTSYNRGCKAAQHMATLELVANGLCPPEAGRQAYHSAFAQFCRLVSGRIAEHPVAPLEHGQCRFRAWRVLALGRDECVTNKLSPPPPSPPLPLSNSITALGL
jgi:hypothetical protein